MYEYVYYKDDEVAQARGLSTSVGTLPILQESNYIRITSSFIVYCFSMYNSSLEGIYYSWFIMCYCYCSSFLSLVDFEYKSEI